MAGRNKGSGGGDAVYGLGMIGAAIYYFSAAEAWWQYVLAIPRAIVWPVFFVYEVMSYVAGL